MSNCECYTLAMKMTISSISTMKKDQKRYLRALREVRQGLYTVVTSDEEVSSYLESLTTSEGKSSCRSNKL